MLERGPSAPISAIASRIGATAPAIIGRFGSKAALVQAALAPPSSVDLLAALQHEPREDGFSSQLTELIDLLADWYQRALPGQLLLRMSPPAQRPRSSSSPRGEPRIQPSLTIWLARAQARGLAPSGEPHALSATVIHALQGWALAGVLAPKEPPPPLEPLRSQLVALLLRR
jgi:AcrR family transcriptional regulator